MTSRARVRFAAGAAAVAGAATLAALVGGQGGASARPAVGVVEPLTALVTAKAGGVVGEVLARPGDRVAKGQPLLRFEAATLVTQRGELRTALESAQGVASIPRAASDVAADAHPDVIAAEDAYVRALARFEQSPAEGRTALDQAAAVRTETRLRVGRMLSKSAAGMASAAATIEARLRDLDRALADRDVRAPMDGVVEILDLRRGDRVPPGGPVGVLIVPGEYVCEFTAPDTAGLVPGAMLRLWVGEVVVEARIERIETRRIPLALREDRRMAEEAVVRARFASGAAIRAGAAARAELP